MVDEGRALVGRVRKRPEHGHGVHAQVGRIPPFSSLKIIQGVTTENIQELVFAFVFVALGIVGKILGCSLTAKPFRYSNREALTIGVGMIARGEVALAIYATGQGLILYEGNKLVGIDPLVPTILLIVVSSVLCPIFLKLVFKNREKAVKAKGGTTPRENGE